MDSLATDHPIPSCPAPVRRVRIDAPTPGRALLTAGDIVWPALCVLALTAVALAVTLAVLGRGDFLPPAWEVGTGPAWPALLVAWGVVVAALALAGSRAFGLHRLRSRRRDVLAQLAEAGWYELSEAQEYASPSARRAGRRWAARRGAGAQYAHVVATAQELARAQARCTARPRDARRHAERDRLLTQSHSAREALRTAVAHGPGGWTAH